MKKRLLAGLVSLAMAVGLIPSAALANGMDASRLTQTATNLDANYISQVQMTFPSDAYSRSMDLVFVLDGSTSSDQTNLAMDAAEMLRDLAACQKLDLQAGLVIFGGSVPILESSDLADMTDTENLDTLCGALVDESYEGITGRSGSNLQAGIEEARELLKAGDADHKYIVVLTDGGARMWYDKDEKVAVAKCYGGTTDAYFNTNQDYTDRFANQDIRPFSQVIAQDEEVIRKYSIGFNDLEHVESTGKDLFSEDYYTNLESSTYFAAKSLMEIKDNDEAEVIWVDYPYSSGKFLDYTESFKSWLADNDYITRYDSNQVCDPFAQVRNDLVYYVDDGSTVENIIGYGTDNYGNAYDFSMVNLDAMKLTVGTDVLAAEKIEDNHYGFGTPDADSRYPFELTYSPNGQDRFELAIHTAVTLDAPVTLEYQVQLTNPQTMAGTYGTYDEDGSEQLDSLRVSYQATLHPVDSNGVPGTDLPFPLPTVSYTVNPAAEDTVQINIMPMTVYVGGEGYEGVVTDIQGDVAGTSESTLPEPGYTIDLPADLNAALKAALGVSAEETVDLSGHLKFTYDDGTETRVWTVERYDQNAGNSSQVNGRYLYRLVSLENQPAVRLEFRDKEGNLMISDDFAIDQDHPNQTYTMSIHAGALDRGLVRAEIQVSDSTDPYRYGIKINGAELKIRGVVSDAENPTTTIQTGKEPEAPVKVITAQVPAGTEYFYKTSDNQSSSIQVADGDAVKLLVDQVLPSATGALEQAAVDQFQEILPERYNIQMRYLDLVYTKNSNAVVAATNPITVYWPYPEGTDRNTEFFLVHYNGLDRNEEEALTGDYTMDLYTADAEGDFLLENTDKGIKFTTKSFSPFALIWAAKDPAPAPGEDKTETTVSPTATPAPAEAAQPAAAAVTAATIIPQTGDNSQPLAWVALLGVSGAALAVLAVLRKKRSDR